MESLTLDFGRLAQETMLLNPLNEDSAHKLLEREYPDAPGVIYFLQKGKGTFGIKGVAVSSIREKMLSPSNQSLLAQIRLDDQQYSLADLDFFVAPSFAGAQMLCETMMNRRFPYHEDMVCNISDPGFSWWGSVGALHFSIYFVSHQVERSGKLIRLGPIGDRKVAARRFQQFYQLFAQYIQKDSYICTEKSLSFSVNQVAGIFLDLKTLLFRGVFSEALQQLTILDRSLYYYFSELATARCFWLEIEQKISLELEQSSRLYC